jgi:C4-dicarboxylate transporter DctM subunit
MSPEIIGAIGLAIMIVLILFGMWIAAAMAIVGFVGYALLRGFIPAIGVLTQIPFSTVNYYPLTTIPLFIFMGVILFNTGIGRDLYDTAYKWVGQLRGGLAMATVLACAMFGAITGISAPALVTMGKVAIPEMKKYGYSDTFAAGSVACAGTLAILIPPSIPMIIYGILTQKSIGQLFMAGLVPGILLSLLFIITIYIVTGVNKKAGPAGPRTSMRVKLGSVKNTWPTVLLFLVILGGIYGGIFTPTEAGAIGAFGALVITAVMRRLTYKIVLDSLLESVRMTAMILLLIVGAYILGKFLAVSTLPAWLGATIGHMAIPHWAVFAMFIVLYVILGMLLDVMSAVIITIPIVYPIVLAMGFDPIWFGVIIVMLVQMGLVTPPVGLDVFILSGAIDVPLFTIFRGIIPYMVAILICIILLMAFPQIALWLPNSM